LKSKLLLNESLYSAIRQGDLGLLRKILDQGVDLEYHDPLRQMPLILAVSRGHQAMVAELISRGCQINGSWKGLHALNYAHQPPIRDLLVAHGALKGPGSKGTEPEAMDREFLSRALGYEVPMRFAVRLNQVLEAMQGTGVNDLYHALGFEIQIPEVRYHSTPAEMFPFGWTGVDGCHLGHVIHAPELGREDHPIGYMDPYSDGPYWYGDDSLQGLNNCLAHSAEMSSDNAEESEILESERIFQNLGFSPTQWGSVQLFQTGGDGRSMNPAPQTGYVHIQTSDKVGVFAPKETFSGAEQDLTSLDLQSSDRYLARAVGCIERSPASALCLLKELWCRHLHRPQVAQHMATCYHLLGRDILIPHIRAD
jgi:hypothetical protein